MVRRRKGLAAVALLPVTGPAPLALLMLATTLMIVSGFVHLHLWDIAYRHIATLGPLFLLQAALAIVMAVILAVTRRLVVVMASMALMIGTMVGFVLVVTVGLFGFTLHEITSWAVLALICEGGAVVTLGLAVYLAVGTTSHRTGVLAVE